MLLARDYDGHRPPSESRREPAKNQEAMVNGLCLSFLLPAASARFAQATARLCVILRISASMAAISAVISSESIASAGRLETHPPAPPECMAAAPTELEPQRDPIDKEVKSASPLLVGENSDPIGRQA
jgi:hypothetical protein